MTQVNPRRKPVPLLAEVEGLFFFDKPSGLLVVPTSKNELRTLVHRVNAEYSAAKGQLWPCHRLDRETTGVILFARGEALRKEVMRLFQQRAVRKTYLAVVEGRLHPPKGQLRSYIQDLDHRRAGRNEPPKLAITRYRVLEQRGSVAVVEVHPVTGRTNQIRIQFSEIGHPLVGDRKYGVGKLYSLKLRRTALHAFELELRHPLTGRRIQVRAPLPDDLAPVISVETRRLLVKSAGRTNNCL